MQNINYAFLLSRPVWGAWIEIVGAMLALLATMVSRAPYGARGLKLLIGGAIGIFGRSRPVWGAWIEILLVQAF